MIIKDLDEQAAELATIGRLLMCTPAGSTNHALEAERDAILHALEHERASTSKLDDYFGQSPAWALLHDLRLELGEHKAHFHHLLIGRYLDIYVIDTTYYHCGLEIGPGGSVQCKHFCPMQQQVSPGERNRRKIRFLNHYLKHNGMLPRRMGLALKPRFHSLLLVSPDANVKSDGSEAISSAEVVRADKLAERFADAEESNGIATIARKAKQIPVEHLREISIKLAQRHLPRTIDYVARYGPARELQKEAEQCSHCQQRVVMHGSGGGQEHGLGQYCYACQRELFDMANYSM
jgi:hypothetical protein